MFYKRHILANKMKQIKRLQEIYKKLKKTKLNLEELLHVLEASGIVISNRQLQRDIKEINPFIKETESLIISRNSKRIKSYQIIDNNKFKDTKNKNNLVKSTNFFHAENNFNSYYIVDNLIQAIKNNYTISINKLNYDFTGDNYLFTQRNIQLKPIEVLFHRGNHYIGGYNIGNKKIQIFEINQIKEVEFIDNPTHYPNLNEKLNKELETRFGISKNINNEIYSIKLEFSLVTGNFVMNQFWHNTQHFETKKGKILMSMQCGINRELIGWLFYWMYNVKIIEPPLLLEYYNKTIEEIKLINSNKHPLVYKNIFNNVNKKK